MESFIPVYQDSTDPALDFRVLLAKTGFSIRLLLWDPTGGLNIGQLTWNEPNKWLVPFFLCYHTDQDSYDGWREKTVASVGTDRH